MRGWAVLIICLFVSAGHGDISTDEDEALMKLRGLLADKENSARNGISKRNNLEGLTKDNEELVALRHEDDGAEGDKVKIVKIKDYIKPVEIPDVDTELAEPFADLPQAFTELKKALDDLVFRMNTVVRVVSENAVQELGGLLEEAQQLVNEENEAITEVTGDGLEAAMIVMDRTEGLVLDISGSIVDMKKRLRCRVKSCTTHRYCRLIGCRACIAKRISSGFWYWKKYKTVRRCDA